MSGSPPNFFDSHRSYSASYSTPGYLMWDGLIRFSPFMDIDIIPGTYDVQYLGPALAEKWEVSQDGLLVTFYLKKGVKWHDGKPFTAKDVKYSLDKMRDPQRSVFTPDFAMVDRVEMVDDFTVKIFLEYPAIRLFLVTIAIGQLTIQAEHLKDVSYRIKEFMVGTGPYKFKSISSGLEMVFDKNPDYHFKGRPYLDGIRFVQFPDNVKGAQSLAVGQIDYMSLGSGEGTEAAVTILRRVAPEVIIRFNPKIGAQSTVWFSFVREGPWQDGRVRKAMAMVVDVKEICVAILGSLAEQNCNPTVGYFFSEPVGRGLPYEKYEKAWLVNRPLEERVKEAKKLLAEAGYPGGFKAQWLASSSLSGYSLVIRDKWQRLLNIQQDTRIVPAAAVMDLIQKGDFEIYTRGSVSWSGAMEQYVSNSYILGGSTNYSFYTHPKVEELYLQLLKERDMDRALQVFHQIERLLIEDVPTIPLYGWVTTWGYWPYVKPKVFLHPVWPTQSNTVFTVIWLDKNDPSYAKRAK